MVDRILKPFELKALRNDYGLVRYSLYLMLLCAPFVTYSNTYLGSVLIAVLQIIIMNIMIRASIKLPKLPRDVMTIILTLLFTMLISLALVFVNYGLSINLFFSATRTIYLIVHIAFGLFTFSYFVDHLPRDSFQHVCGQSSVLIILATIFMFLDPVLVGQLAEGDFVFAYNRRYIGYFALASSVFFSVRIFFEKATAMDSLYLCCSFSLMLWLGGRGTVVAYTGTIIIVCVLLYLHNNLSIRKTCTLAMILIASCAISMPLSIYEWNGLNRFQLLSETLNAIESGSVLSRFKLWQESIQLFSASPWFGLGADGYKLFSITHFFQPHNVVFQCLVEFGFIGTSCILYLLNRAVTIMARTSTSHLDPPLISLMAVVIALFIQSLVSGNLYHAGSIAQFFMFLAMTLALCVQVKSSSRELVEHNSSATSSQID